MTISTKKVRIITNKVSFHSVHGLHLVRSAEEPQNVQLQNDISAQFDRLLGIPFGTEKNQNVGDVKKGKSLFPYTSFTAIGISDDYVMICFEASFSEAPVTFVCDVKQKVVKNYLDMSIAAMLLDDNLFEQTEIQLHRRKNFQKAIPLIDEINSFVNDYKKILELNKGDLVEISKVL